MRRDVLVNIGLLLATVFLFFGGIEFFLRVSGIQETRDTTPPIYQKNDDPIISYELIPNNSAKAFRNTVTTNSLGFRSEESNGTKPIIAVLGDSITFGYGVADHETLPAQLNALLPNYSVQNAAVPGYNIRQQIRTFETKILPLEPAALLLVFYWNDADLETSWLDESNVLRAEGWKPQQRTCQPIETGIMGLIPGKCWLDLHSAFYKIVKKVVDTRSGKQRMEEVRTESVTDEATDSFTQKDLLLYKQEITKLETTVPTFFVIWPDAQMHATSRSKLRAIARQKDFVVIDLYDHFGNTLETLSWDYIHPSPRSLQKAAAVIYRELSGHPPLSSP